MKKILGMFMLLVVSTAVFAGGNGESGGVSESSVKIGLVTDTGEVDDKGFNQSSWEGVKDVAKKFNARSKYIETKDSKDYDANISILVENGYSIIVTVGFAMAEATYKAAQIYPDVYFIGVDQFPGWTIDDDASNDVANYTGLIFNEYQPGFLAGALAAMMTKANIIAGIFGTNLVPPVVKFKEGYENGARYINTNIKIISTYHPGGMDTAFGDPEWGATTASQAIDNGADVIFAAGGKTGNGALIEAATRGVYSIGVDTDQWETVLEARPTLLSSAIKLISQGIEDLVTKHLNGEAIEAMYVGEGGLAPFHDMESTIPNKVKARLKDIDMKIKNGSIKTVF